MATEGKPISLVLIDDNRLLREGLAAMIHEQPGFKVLAASADVDEALSRSRGKPSRTLSSWISGWRTTIACA